MAGRHRVPNTMAQIIAEHSSKAIQLSENFHQKWAPILAKQITKYEALVKELIDDSLASCMEVDSESLATAAESESQQPSGGAGPELSVHAQYILEECLEKIRALLNEMLLDHRQIHPPISKCGKDLDRYFQSDLSKLMKNEKAIDSNPDNLQRANRLIFDHLMSLGRVEVAKTFARESELKLPEVEEMMGEGQRVGMRKMQKVMESLRSGDYMPAIKWVQEKRPECEDLLFRLHSQYMVQLLIQGNRKEAVLYGRKLDPFKDRYREEISHLMFVSISYPNCTDRYAYLFDEGRWLALEEEVASVMCPETRSPLRTILDVGAKAIPALITLRSLTRRTSHGNHEMLMVDELPVDVSVPNQVHSSFTCPILKVQSTESNPPMRLNCGHVISQEALNKLAAQSRNQRLKCPYCPEESNYAEAKRVYF